MGSHPHKRPLNVLGLNEVPRVDVDGGGRRKSRTGQRSAKETEKEVGQEEIQESMLLYQEGWVCVGCC